VISTSRKDMLVWNVWSKCFPKPLHFHLFSRNQSSFHRHGSQKGLPLISVV
jgi:hypothetical protein